jgi:hypothetical protein
MPVDLVNNEILLRCACGDLKHIAYLVYDPGKRYKGADWHFQSERIDWYLTVTLNSPGTFARIRQAARYIFAPHTFRFGNYIELALRNEDIDRLAEFIEVRRERDR